MYGVLEVPFGSAECNNAGAHHFKRQLTLARRLSQQMVFPNSVPVCVKMFSYFYMV